MHQTCDVVVCIFLTYYINRELGIFLLTTTSRTPLGPTQPPIQCIAGAPSLRIKQLGHEADLHSPNTPSWRGAQLKSTGTTLPLPLLVKEPFLQPDVSYIKLY
jgi:hypothetical protein